MQMTTPVVSRFLSVETAPLLARGAIVLVHRGENDVVLKKHFKSNHLPASSNANSSALLRNSLNGFSVVKLP